MNHQLRDARSKASRLLSISSPGSPGFNLSDLKTDKTQFIDSPRHKMSVDQQDEFEPSARSTGLRSQASGSRRYDMMQDIGDIMQTSTSQAVQKRFRESLASNERPYRTTMSTDMNASGASSYFGREARAAKSQCIRLSEESFQPGEDFGAQLAQGELEHEQENMTIPGYDADKARKSSLNDTEAENPPEMSFGAHCNQYKNDDIWDIYSNPSPPKKSRVPLIDVTNDELSIADGTLGPITDKRIKKMLKDMPTPTAASSSSFFNFSKDCNDVHRIIQANTSESDPRIQDAANMLSHLDFSRIKNLSEKEITRQRNRSKYDDDLIDIFPSKESDLQDEASSIASASRQQNIRREQSPFQTPLTALAKYLPQKKSPNPKQKELRSQKLKPAVSESLFKIPNSINETNSKSRTREYNMSHSTGEKLSLPNLNLARSTTSPISKSQLKRTTSQLSTGSEFNDENLPIKFPKSQRRISFPSVKVQMAFKIELTIQNGSEKRLPLLVKVVGAGFSTAIQENLRMLPQEVRSIEIHFRPTQVGAYRGELIFELATNSSVFKKIPLFGYGGHSAMKIDGLQKPPLGPNFLTMGLVKNINAAMEKKITFTNVGTMAAFAVVCFEKSKISEELCSSNSVRITPEDFRLYPGEAQEVTIRFKPRKEEIRKIINLNKEVTVVGELFVMCSDDATRLRLLSRREQIPVKLSDFLPQYLEGEEDIIQELSSKNFHENIDEKTLHVFSQKLFRQHIALTLDRNLDETQMIAAQISLSDESMSFCDDDVTVMSNDFEEKFDEDFYLESRYFRVQPATLVFNVREDCLQKPIKITSMSDTVHYVEAVSSNPNLVSAVKQCGKLRPNEKIEIEVTVKPNAFEEMESSSIFILVGDARLEVPVRFV